MPIQQKLGWTLFFLLASLQVQAVLAVNEQASWTESEPTVNSPTELAADADWHPGSDNVASRGFTRSVLWLRLQWPPRGLEPEHRYLALPYPLLEHLAIFEAQPEGFRLLEERQHSSPHHLIPLSQLSPQTSELIIRAQSHTAMQVPLELWSGEDLQTRQNHEMLLWGIYFGILVGLMAYNGFVWYSVRDRSYGWYVGYLAGISGLMLAISGLGKWLLWGTGWGFHSSALITFTTLSCVCGLMFTRCFLAWGNHATPLGRILYWLAAALLVLGSIMVWLPQWSPPVAGSMSVVVFVAIMSSAWLAHRRGNPISLYFMIAWGFLALGSLLYVGNVFTLVPASLVTTHALQAGSALEAILLSLALAHRIKVEREEKLRVLALHHEATREIAQMRVDALEHSLHDPGTGMPNEALLRDRLDRWLAAESLRETSLGLIVVQFSRLKEVAPALGRAVTDNLFLGLVRDFNAVLREDGSAMEIDGKAGQFLAVLQFSTVAMVVKADEGQEALAFRLRKMLHPLEQHVPRGELAIARDYRAGIQWRPAGEPLAGGAKQSAAERLLHEATLALDKSCRDGPRISFHHPDLDARGLRRVKLQSALASAIEEHEFELHLQPQFCCQSDTLCGAEALIRWYHPEMGEISPGEFIPLAEETGMIDRVTRIVIEEVLVIQKLWQSRGIVLPVSVNLSVHDLMQPDLASWVINRANEQYVPMDLLVFEVTETAMSGNLEEVHRNLNQLAKAGSRIALDDFGTGYSSLTYLSRLPVHEIKIDRSFVSQMTYSHNDMRIVDNTIRLAAALQLETVAEGIEDQAILDMLKDLGCRRVQGFLLGRPMNLEAFNRLPEVVSARRD